MALQHKVAFVSCVWMQREKKVVFVQPRGRPRQRLFEGCKVVYWQKKKKEKKKVPFSKFSFWRYCLNLD